MSSVPGIVRSVRLCSCLLILVSLFSTAYAADVNPSVLPGAAVSDAGNEIDMTAQERQFLKQKGRVTMCVDPDWMPLERIEGGRHVGIAADYMAILQKRLGIPIELVPTENWVQSVEFAKSRRCDILSLAMPTPSRYAYLVFTRPYLRLPLVLATRDREPFVADITVITDEPLGVVRGYAFSEILRRKYPDLDIRDVDSVEAGLDRVEQGELYGFIGTLATVGYALQNRHPELKIAGKFDEYWELGIGLRNDQPLLFSAFQKAVDSLSRRQSQEILNRWISVKYDKAIDYSLIWEGLGATALLLLFLLYRQRMLQKHNRELLELTRTDALTGVGSRHYLDQELDRLLNHYRRYGSVFSIMLIDMDYFKKVNDRFGHLTGDRVLIEFVGLVNQHLRKTDVFGRWGGEEFLLICPRTALPQAEILAERIRGTTERHDFKGTGRQTVSIGIAACESPDITTARLVSIADEALYAAKAAGRNRVMAGEPRPEQEDS